ncbi:MAG: DUF2059 domain-containing protein [Pyrinomonadaceae bacterium]
MQMHKSSLLLITVLITLCGSASSFAQQEISTDKRALISEFRVLTGANNVEGSIKFSAAGVNEILSKIVEQDKELTDPQRAQLAELIKEATERVARAARTFLDDKSQIVELSEQTIFKLYDKSFTESELKELIAFYRTATGRKAAVFLPSLSGQVQKAFGEVIQAKLNPILQPKIQIEVEQLKQQIKDLKAAKNLN